MSTIVCASTPAPPPLVGPSIGSLAVVARTLVAPRDPERPKKPLSGYFRFLDDFRQASKGRLAHLEVTKQAGVEWNSLPDAKKAPYNAAYAAQKKDFDAALQAYKASGKADAWKRDPSLPVRPQTGFLLFSAEVRAKNTNMKVTEQSKLAGSQWTAMSEQAKQPYEQRAATEWVRYKEAMKQYKESGKGEAWKEKKGLTPKEKVKAKEAATKEKEKAKLQLAKGKLRLAAQKEKEKVAKAKATAKARAAKAKELEAAKKAKAKDTAAREKARAQLKSPGEKAALAKDKVKSRAVAAKAVKAQGKGVAAKAVKAKARGLAATAVKAKAKGRDVVAKAKAMLRGRSKTAALKK